MGRLFVCFSVSAVAGVALDNFRLVSVLGRGHFGKVNKINK